MLTFKTFLVRINFGRVRGLLIALNIPPPTASLVAQLCVVNDRLPQGAPTSPVLSNLIARKLDGKLEALARRTRCIYTRFADDLTFSAHQSTLPREMFASDAVGLELDSIIQAEGFRINAAKILLRSHTQRQIVTGLVVNKKLNVRRKVYQRVRCMIRAWEAHGLDACQRNLDLRYLGRRAPRFENMVHGYIAFCPRSEVETTPSSKGSALGIVMKWGLRLSHLASRFRKVPAGSVPTSALHS